MDKTGNGDIIGLVGQLVGCNVSDSMHGHRNLQMSHRVILILMKFRILILACCQVVLTASLVSELFLFSL